MRLWIFELNSTNFWSGHFSRQVLQHPKIWTEIHKFFENSHHLNETLFKVWYFFHSRHTLHTGSRHDFLRSSMHAGPDASHHARFWGPYASVFYFLPFHQLSPKFHSEIWLFRRCQPHPILFSDHDLFSSASPWLTWLRRPFLRCHSIRLHPSPFFRAALSVTVFLLFINAVFLSVDYHPAISGSLAGPESSAQVVARSEALWRGRQPASSHRQELRGQ